MVAILKIKLRKTGAKFKTNPRYNVWKLGELNVKNAFVLQLKNRFQELARTDDYNIHPVTEETNTKWEKVKSAYQKASETCLGTQQARRKEWITADTWQAIEQRRNVKKKWNEAKSNRLKERYKLQYQEINREVRRKVRVDKGAFVDNLARQVEDVASKGEQGKVYKIIRVLSGKRKITTVAPIADKQGKLLTTDAKQDARWAEHFS